MRWRSAATPALLIAGLAVAALLYGPSLDAPFFGDDYALGTVLDGGRPDPARLASEFTGPWGGVRDARYYRPLVAASVTIDAWFFGFTPFSIRFTNLLLHTLNALLVATVVRRLGRASALWSAGAGVLFLVHPIAAAGPGEAVLRPDVLSAFFVLLALVASHRRSRRAGALAIVAFASGLLTKEVAIVALPALALVGRSKARTLGLVATAVGWFVVRRLALGDAAGASLTSRIAVAARWENIVHVAHGLQWLVAPTVAVGACVAVLAVARRPWRAAVAAACLVVAPIVLAADLWVALDGALPVANNRLLYLPLAGLLWLLAAPRVPRRAVASVRVVALVGWIALSIPVASETLARLRAVGAVTERTASTARALASARPGAWVVLATPPDPLGFVDSGSWFPFAMRPPFADRACTRIALSTAYSRSLRPTFETVIRASGIPVFALDAAGRANAIPAAPPGDAPRPRIAVADRALDVRLADPAAWRDVTLWIVTQGMPIRAKPTVDPGGRLVVGKPVTRMLGQLADLYAPLELLVIVRARDTDGRVCQSVPAPVSIERTR